MNPCCKYAHYYMGNRFRFTWRNGDFIEDTLSLINDIGFITGTNIYEPRDATKEWYEINDFRKDGDFQLILIHPCDMPKHQLKKYKSLCKNIWDSSNKSVLHIADTPESLDYLFNNSIDVFDLIERGFAIDKNKK